MFAMKFYNNQFDLFGVVFGYALQTFMGIVGGLSGPNSSTGSPIYRHCYDIGSRSKIYILIA